MKSFLANVVNKSAVLARNAKIHAIAASYSISNALTFTKCGRIANAQRGKQFGLLFRVLETDVYLISELRKEYYNTPSEWMNIAEINGSELAIEQDRLELADLTYPIYITSDKFVIDGHHRLMKAKKLGNTKIKVVVVKTRPHMVVPAYMAPLKDYVK